MNPKVFIIHASEDKDRFVVDFATRLRAKGVDAWVDKWEMTPGDSLIEKIFEEGLKNAEAILVILSGNSVGKKWVKEELNAAMIKKIEGKCKLIPVLIERCSVPDCLHTILWQEIKDINSYDEELHRIMLSIYGQNEKPPLGETPVYTQMQVDVIPNLTRLDSLILKLSCEQALEQGMPHINVAKLLEKVRNYKIEEEACAEIIEVLGGRGYFELIKSIGSRLPSHFLITLFGFDEYMKVYVKDYGELIKKVGYQIINFNIKNNRKLSETLGLPLMLVNHILDRFEYQGFVTLSKELGGGVFVAIVSPELKRRL